MGGAVTRWYASECLAYSPEERVESEVAQSCPTLCNPMDCIACQAPPSMGLSRREYWSGSPFPLPGDLPDPGIETGSPSLRADALPSEPPGKPQREGWKALINQHMLTSVV